MHDGYRFGCVGGSRPPYLARPQFSGISKHKAGTQGPPRPFLISGINNAAETITVFETPAFIHVVQSSRRGKRAPEGIL